VFLLAGYDKVIVDEANNLPELVGLFFGFALSSYRLRDWYTDWQKLDPAWSELAAPADAVLQALEQLQRSIPSRSERLGRDELLADQRFSQRLDELQLGLAELATKAEEGADTPARQQLLLRVLELQNQATDWQSAQDEQAVCWAQRSQRGFGLHALPLDVSALSQSGFAAQQGSWVFVSATLSVNGDFQYIRDRLGLDETTPCLRYPSPFDYPVQGRLYVPRALGQTGHGIDHTKAVLKQAWPLLQEADGGAFVLCTSLRAVQEAAELLRQHGPWRVLEQGSEANGLLLERFKRDGHAVLVGAASFWEGVDVPGDSLRLVIIDRLPFQSPADPVHAAQRRRVERMGQSAFARVDLPPTAVALQQAVGRLLRRETDFGVVMIGDTRLVTKGYGRQLRASLPPLPLEQEVEPVRRFLREQMALRAHTAA
jgi:ATP-dependent DNA helicase DinG